MLVGFTCNQIGNKKIEEEITISLKKIKITSQKAI